MGASITASKITPLRRKNTERGEQLPHLAAMHPGLELAPVQPGLELAPGQLGLEVLRERLGGMRAQAKMKSARASTNSSRCPPVTAHPQRRT